MKPEDSILISGQKKNLRLWYDEEAPYGNENISKAYAATQEYKDIENEGLQPVLNDYLYV